MIAALTLHGRAQIDPDDPADTHPSLQLAAKLTGCGRHAAVLWHEGEQRPLIGRALCKSRLCPTCGMKRAQRLRSTLLPIVRQMDSARLITLTLKSSDAPLENQLKRLTAAFAKLRRRKAGKKYLRGGIYVIEVTYNAEADQWHPHLHVVAEGRYWPQHELADLWQTITGDSRIVDLRACHDRRSTVNYVTSYVSKSQTPRDVSPERLWEWCQATHGRPLARPFGNCHGARLSPKPESIPSGTTNLLPLDALLDSVEQQDPAAAELYSRLMALITGQGASTTDEDPSATAEEASALRDELEAWWLALRYAQTGDPRYAPWPTEPEEPPPADPQQPLYSQPP